MASENDWVCYRPQYYLSRLEYDLVHQGFEALPSVVFGLPAATTRLDDDGRIWARGLPHPSDILDRLMRKDENHQGILVTNRTELRKASILFVARMRSMLLCDHNTEELICIVREYADFQHHFLPFVLVVTLTDLLIIERFEDLLLQFLPFDFVKCFIPTLLSSPWAELGAKQGRFPPHSKQLMLPAPLPIYFETCESICDLSITSPYDGIARRSVIATQLYLYDWYRTNVPLFAQWGDENLYLLAMVRTHFNLLLEALAGQLVRQGLILDRRGVLDLRLAELNMVVSR